MLVLITYDVSTLEAADRRRLRKVAQVCQNYGQRVQKSVFECQVGQKEWIALKDGLLSTFDCAKDSLRFYFLDETAVKRIEHHGLGKPVDLADPLIL